MPSRDPRSRPPYRYVTEAAAAINQVFPEMSSRLGGHGRAVQPEDIGRMLQSHDFSESDLRRVAAALQRSLDEVAKQNHEAAKISQALDQQISQYERMSAALRRQEESQKLRAEPVSGASTTSNNTRVKTPGRFSFMELPPELRIKICRLLLISPAEKISVPSKPDEDETRPHTAILQTCRQLNEEGTPLLYGHNNFAITLSASPSSLPLLCNLRWDNIRLMKEITFVSAPPDGEKVDPAPFFCTGDKILAQFSYTDFRLSPLKMDSYQIRHASNWISCQVMKVELASFQQQWKELMEPTLPGLDWDLATLHGIPDI